MPRESDRWPLADVLAQVTQAALKHDGVLRVGVTGTRHLDDRGREALENLMLVLAKWVGQEGLDCEIVQGGCVGADAYAAAEAKKQGFRVYTILPETMTRVPADWQSWTDGWEVGGDYRQRNKKIVQRSAMLFVVADYPEQHGKSRRSGTWMTARMAKEALKPLWRCVQHDD